MSEPKTSIVIMRWIPQEDKWHMSREDGFFLFPYYDCANVNIIFPDLSKFEDNAYEVQIRKVNKASAL